MRTPPTPVTPVTDPLRYDGLDAVTAVLNAWEIPGPHPGWHERRKSELRQAMPLLGRALDRLAEEASRA